MNRKQRRIEATQHSAAQGRSVNALAVFSAAVSHHQAGDLDKAIAGYRAVLKLKSNSPEAYYNLSLALAARGDAEEAVACCRQVVTLQPGNAEAHNNLGNLLTARGDWDGGMASLRRAIQVNPLYAEAHDNLGSALKTARDLEGAIASFQRAVAIKPGFAQAHSNLGNALHAQGRPEEAAAACRSAIALMANLPLAHNNLGNALRDLGQTTQAMAAYRQAIALKPNLAEAWSNLGRALQEHGDLEEAIACCRRAVTLKPDFPAGCNNLGNALVAAGRFTEAVSAYQTAIALQPAFVEAHNNLGNALGELSKPNEAIEAFNAAIALNPDFAAAYNNLGNLLVSEDRIDEGIALYHEALRRNPSYTEAHSNLGNAFVRCDALDEAIACYNRALSLSPDYVEGHLNLGLALLGQGDMAKGWEEYEWRRKMPVAVKSGRRFAQPQWFGEAALGQTLLIHAEQGFGDTLQFCRYAAVAAARGLRVVMEVQKPLARLLRGMAGPALVLARGDALPDFDLHCPMLSLPLAVGTTVATIPGPVGYLRADGAQIAAWRDRLAAATHGGAQVGLVWAGASRLPADRRRSLAPAQLAPLLTVPGLNFVSLQKDGLGAFDGAPIVDFMAEMTDFADTAALIANLDLVIAVDTAVAHLAGALGKPVWLLDRFDCCWRWLRGHRDSPWYPNLRIYRQPRLGDWAAILGEITQDLHDFARGDVQP